MAHPGSSVPPLINLTHSIVAGGAFTQHITNQHHYTGSGERSGGYARLLENVATAALHDSVDNVDPPKCHPNTRVAIIENIHDWTVGTNEELSGKPILWLKGAAGAGKSAIARSVAERSSNEGLLLGTFFFNAGDMSRNHVGYLVATISYQISTCLPGFRDVVSSIIGDNPLIFKSSLKTQLLTLVIRPLSTVLANCSITSSTTPRLIIIDGLDECSAVSSQRDLVLTLQEVTNMTTLVRFLVSSRPESHLNNTFSLSEIVPILYKICLEDFTGWKDIQVYLEDKFKQIKEGHPFKHMLPNPWPAPEIVDALVSKSFGQFIYAATIIRYVDSSRHRPDQRLNAILNLRPPFKDLPFTELDALYRLIISKADDLPTVLDILAFPALYGSFECRDIEAILQLEEGTVEVTLADLHSIVRSSDDYVEFLHKSLADFLCEPQRGGDLYRDLSRARLSHVARVISIFSTQHDQQGSRITFLISKPIGRLKRLAELEKSDTMKGDYVSFDILQAAQQFPTFEYFTPLLLSTSHPREPPHWQRQANIPDMLADHIFIRDYFDYIYAIKDAFLDDNLSGNWSAHFVFMYCDLLHDPRYCLPRKLSYVDLDGHGFSNINVGMFGYTIPHNTGPTYGPRPYFNDIVKIFHELIGDIKRETIFAMSASFCLSLLCDGSQNADHIYGITRITTARRDHRKKRDHPWHWRQTVPRPPSLGNRLTLIGFRPRWDPNYYLTLRRTRKVLRKRRCYMYDSTRVITMREYFEGNSEWPRSMKEERRQQWPLYVFLLNLVPHILPLAGRYEPLVDMCRKKCLSSLSQVWPKKSRRARQAIDSYLCRMDAQEGGE
ncbi:hypothetical protein D9613_003592 [Agrocybe pediades]|uniref:Nephrocystin 3-like N-terminal domain-containing protein n=1 Tax=Agrocybe pediades TaxID=84607 RepID=A0A8H4VKX1_9AGAR|nr:hypothetical protein D9613_003592 [Agrocybe pediades]